MQKLSKADIILIIMAICLVVYTGMRAAIISMTHDESSSYLNYINQSLFECFYSEVCWGTANLHLTNTFLMQISVKIFGPHPFFVRLPNVLAHILYLFFSIKLVRAITDKPLIAIAGFLLLNAHPYLLDFFSLGRGYGLACGFMMMSIYYLYLLLKKCQWQAAALCILGAILAVLSNFTFLNYFAILGAFLGLWTIFILQAKGLPKWYPLGIYVLSALLLAVLLYYPIIYLKGGGEFGFGVDSLWQTFNQLIQDDTYGQGYFGSQTGEIFLWISILVIGLAILVGLVQGIQEFRKNKNSTHVFYFACSSLWLLLIVALITQHELLQTQFLRGRTALIFFPLSALPVFMLLHFCFTKYPKLLSGSALIIIIFLCLHFTRTANLIVAREWYYDAHTHEMLQYLEKKVPEGQQVHLGVYWLYTHSSNFYWETQNLDFLKEIKYEREIRKDSLYDYYYVEPGHGDILHPDYELDKQFGWVSRLYKRKDMP